MSRPRLTDKDIEEYREFLQTKENTRTLLEAWPLLTKSQRRFCETVMAVCDNGDEHLDAIAKITGVSQRTVKRAIVLIKDKYLPFRVSKSMACKMVEKQFNGAKVSFGSSKASTLERKSRKDNRKYRTKRIDI